MRLWMGGGIFIQRMLKIHQIIFQYTEFGGSTFTGPPNMYTNNSCSFPNKLHILIHANPGVSLQMCLSKVPKIPRLCTLSDFRLALLAYTSFHPTNISTTWSSPSQSFQNHSPTEPPISTPTISTTRYPPSQSFQNHSPTEPPVSTPTISTTRYPPSQSFQTLTTTITSTIIHPNALTQSTQSTRYRQVKRRQKH